MSTFGGRLRLERERRNVTLQEISGATRVPRHYLEALEADDFAHLPADVFNRGYVRAYAQFIGLDPEPWLEAYARARQSRQAEISGDDSEVVRALVASVVRASAGLERETATRPGSGRRTKRRALPVVIAVVLVAALGGAAGWGYFRSSEPDAPGRARVAPERSATAPPSVAVSPPRSRPSDAAPGSAAPTRTASVPAAVPAAEGRLAIPESGVGTRVVDRRLHDRRERFAEGTRVAFWTRVVGGEAGERVRHVWLHGGREVESVELTLGGPHWRTHSHKTLTPGSVGRWAVEARDAAGRVLAREEFTCEAQPGG